MIRAMQMMAALIPLCMSVSAVQATSAIYQCGDGTRLTADFSPPSLEAGHVDLSIRGGAKVTVPQQMSADGGRYANARMEFWIKGNKATLTRVGRSVSCQLR
jgi:membrane-bound inhibitor of C-type lysozyme